MKQEASVARRFDRIVELLWSQDEQIRQTGMDELRAFRKETKDPGLEVGLAALRAATRPYPFEKPNPGYVAGELVEVAASEPLPEYLPVIVELFGRFPEDAKWRAQILVTELESREAAEAFMAIVRTHAPTGKLNRLFTVRLVHKPRHADVLFPEILKYAKHQNLSFDIYRLCLAYCEEKLLPRETLALYSDQVIDDYEALAAKLRPAQKGEGTSWLWEDAYGDSRFDAALLLDLLGHLPVERAEPHLRDALEFKDPRLKYFAVLSLLKLGRAVDRRHVEDVARHAEMRILLVQSLETMGQGHLYPDSFRTQRAFAEGDMVSWLCYPTELGRPPDEIQLMKVVVVDTGVRDGVYEYYLFRFRTREPHWAAKYGWMAGVSGPFLRKDQPTTESLGDTFSSFTKWDEKSPDEHVGDIKELMKEWREYHLKNKN